MKKIALLSAALFVLLLSPVLNHAAPVPDGVIVNGQAAASFTWTAPVDRTDGTALSPDELAGFVIYWSDAGRFLADGVTLRTGCSVKSTPDKDSTDCYSNAFDIANGVATTHQMTLNLTQDTTLFFTMAAYDVDGNWSDYSNEVSQAFTLETQVNDPNPPILDSIQWAIDCTTNKASMTCTFTVSEPAQ